MNNTKVLIVDDEKDFTDGLKKLLRQRGCLVHAVNDGGSAVRLLKTIQFDVIILDLKMPGLNGMETLKQIRKQDSFVETLILTGHGSIEAGIATLEIGAYTYLEKPCAIELLVDDEIVFTKNVAKLLSARGYIADEVSSGDGAIRVLQEKKYDVVVLDLKMPGMDGLATLKEIKKLGLFTETLILTGHGSIDSALEAVKLGAYDYLTKPCQVEDLVAKIEGAFERKYTEERKDLDEKIGKIVESPSAVFDLFPNK